MSKIIFGIDLGNKQTKLKSEKSTYRLPSHYTVKDTLASGISTGFNSDFDIHTFKTEDGLFAWGSDIDKTLVSEKIKDTIGVDDNRYDNPLFHNLATFAIALLANDFMEADDDTLNVSIVTGLPTEDFEKPNCIKAIKKALKKHVMVEIDGKPIDVKVDDVIVIPQPLGSVIDVVTNEKEKDVLSELINVIDLGGGTVLVDTLQNAGYDSKKTVQLSSGSFTLFKQIRYQMIKQYGVSPSVYDIEQIVREGSEDGKYVYRQHKGAETNISDLVKDNIDSYTQDVIDDITTNLDGVTNVDETFVTGGGSEIINKEMFEKAFNNVKFTKHNEKSNVIGFYQYGLNNLK